MSVIRQYICDTCSKEIKNYARTDLTTWVDNVQWECKGDLCCDCYEKATNFLGRIGQAIYADEVKAKD